MRNREGGRRRGERGQVDRAGRAATAGAVPRRPRRGCRSGTGGPAADLGAASVRLADGHHVGELARTKLPEAALGLQVALRHQLVVGRGDRRFARPAAGQPARGRWDALARAKRPVRMPSRHCRSLPVERRPGATVQDDRDLHGWLQIKAQAGASAGLWPVRKYRSGACRQATRAYRNTMPLGATRAAADRPRPPTSRAARRQEFRHASATTRHRAQRHGHRFVVAEYRAEEKTTRSPRFTRRRRRPFLSAASRRAAAQAPPASRSQGAGEDPTRYFDDMLERQIAAGCRPGGHPRRGLDTRAVRKAAHGGPLLRDDDAATMT